jgi:sugar phosphate permease
VWEIKLLWCLNGLSQAAIWPNVVKLLTTMLPEKEIPRGLTVMHTTNAAGLAGAFLLSSGSLKWLTWKAAFVIPGFILFIFGLVWINGFLRDGIVTWLPGYIHDTFHIENALAVLISVIIPMSQISGAFFARKIYSGNKGNAFAFIGSMGASSSFGLGADIFGWDLVLFLIAGASFISGVLCLGGYKRTGCLSLNHKVLPNPPG